MLTITASTDAGFRYENVMRYICMQTIKPSNHKQLNPGHLIDSIPITLLTLLTACSPSNQTETYGVNVPPSTTTTPQNNISLQELKAKYKDYERILIEEKFLK